MTTERNFPREMTEIWGGPIERTIGELADITETIRAANRIIAEQSRAIAMCREALAAFHNEYNRQDGYRAAEMHSAAKLARAALALCEGK